MMRPNSSLADSRPKFSSMPRQKTEAAAYLNLYKLSIEKKRLEHELATLETRRGRIQKRLAFLNSQVAELDKNAQQNEKVTPSEQASASAKEAAPDTTAFNTLFLEY
jgi:Skp family chaperone for outer membrane proteins